MKKASTTWKNEWQIAQEIHSQKVGKIFDALDGGHTSKRSFEYSDLACAIMTIVKNKCEGFVVDICERFTAIDNRYAMTDKQRWCVAFAFAKLTAEQVADYIATLPVITTIEEMEAYLNA